MAKAVLWRDLPEVIKDMKQPDRRSDILNSIFMKIDYLEAPEILKPIVGDTASATLNPISMFMQLNVADVERSEVAAYDTKRGVFSPTDV